MTSDARHADETSESIRPADAHRRSNANGSRRDIASFDPDIVDPAFLHARARELGYHLDIPRLSIVFGISADIPVDAIRQDVSVLRADLVRIIRERFHDAEDIVAATTPGRFVVLHRLPSSSIHPDVSVTELCDAIAETVRMRHDLTMRAAIGGAGTTLAELRSALLDASDGSCSRRRSHPRRPRIQSGRCAPTSC